MRLKSVQSLLLATATMVAVVCLLFVLTSRENKNDKVVADSTSTRKTVQPTSLTDASDDVIVDSRIGGDLTTSREALVQPSTVASAAADPVIKAWQALNSSADTLDALDEARTLLGNSSPDYASIVAQLSAACSRASEAALRYQMDTPPKGVAWAMALLDGKCANLKLTKELVPKPAGAGPMLKHLQGDAAGALSDAWDNLSQSTSALQLAESIELLGLAGSLPEEAIFGQGSNLSGTDRETIVRAAAQLIECRFSRQCGPGTVSVAAYCVTQGCSQTAALDDAMRDAMSQRNWEATQRMVNWVLSQRSSHRP